MSQELEELPPYSDEKKAFGTITISGVAVTSGCQNRDWQSDDNPKPPGFVRCEDGVAYFEHESTKGVKTYSKIVQYHDGIAYMEVESNQGLKMQGLKKPILRLPALFSKGKACNHLIPGKACNYLVAGNANFNPGPDGMDSLRKMPIDNFSIFCLVLVTAHHGYILNFPGFFPLPIMVKIPKKPSGSLKKWKPAAAIGRVKFRLKAQGMETPKKDQGMETSEKDQGMEILKKHHRCIIM